MFSIEQRDPQSMARAGILHTEHGAIKTPAYIVVGTAATVRGVPTDSLPHMGVQAVLANTYHLMLEPGTERVAKAGGLAEYMRWNGPTFTDSGGFQVFSLGSAFGQHVSKVAQGIVDDGPGGGAAKPRPQKRAHIDEDGVTFKSHRNGSLWRLTPESSMEHQWNIGADIIFAFDECTSPTDPYDYQLAAWQRTERWAHRCIARHNELDTDRVQSLFGVVQGGPFEELRRLSARTLGMMDFDGFGIGGSFTKGDLETAVKWVNEELPEDKPRHLLGIGEPLDLLAGIAVGCDTFDCVIPTRIGRHGSVFTASGKIHIQNASYRDMNTVIEEGCDCPVCTGGYTCAYINHLFRANEMLALTLVSQHNIRFLVRLVEQARIAIIEGRFPEFRANFESKYKA
jgi:queuine tRNA-ribosyltransferase